MKRFPALSINTFFLTAGSLLLVLFLYLFHFPFLDLMELKTVDLRFRSRAPNPPSTDIILAAVDEKSLHAEGRWPWPRARIAALVNQLSAAGAKVIGFSISFNEPESGSQEPLLNQLRSSLAGITTNPSQLNEVLSHTGDRFDGDRLLAEAVERSTASIVLGYFFQTGVPESGYGPSPEEIERRLDGIRPSRYPFVKYDSQRQEIGEISVLDGIFPESNYERLARATPHSGHFNMKADPDGVVRWMPLVIRSEKNYFPALPVETAWQFLDQPALIVTAAAHGITGIKMGNRVIPTDERGQLFINYSGPEKTFTKVSATDILQGRFAEGTFTDKIVLLGTTAIGTFNSILTPYSSRGTYPGIEVHATVIDNILKQAFLVRPKWTRVYDLAGILLLGALTGWISARMNALRSFLLALLLLFAHILVARWFFTQGFWLNMVYPLFALVLVYTVVTVHRYIDEELERKKIRSAFGRYAPETVISEMLKDPEKLKLGGEERELSVLFCDLAGFTTYSERLAPREMVSLLSEYFEAMTEQVFANCGMLKEYVGDELMAIFGAPLHRLEHARNACATALAMQERLASLNRVWRRAGRPVLEARTGINSGPMLVGNIGSSYRFSYGVLGDAVNLGSRLESLNKIYGTRILMGENSARMVADDFLLREIDRVTVKGKTEAVSVYELIAPVGSPATELSGALIQTYASGLEAYRGRHWEIAIDRFAQAAVLQPEDGPSHTMIHRCKTYQATPPPEDWGGIFYPLQK